MCNRFCEQELGDDYLARMWSAAAPAGVDLCRIGAAPTNREQASASANTVGISLCINVDAVRCSINSAKPFAARLDAHQWSGLESNSKTIS